MTVSELAQGLQALGYKLAQSEVTALAEQVHPASKQSGAVDKSAFLASQLDWNSFMSDHRYVPVPMLMPSRTDAASEDGSIHV